jgi:uncharacterized protein YqjF (DUF2071 family)
MEWRLHCQLQMRHPALTRTEHRPWPLPAQPWLWRQTWHDLLFAHWPVRVSAIRDLVPRWLAIEQHSGSSWVGLVPFRMTGVTLRGVPSLPVISQFPEMNLRLYVERDGKPGVWFVSLDAARVSAVLAARLFAHLPYFVARMRVSHDGRVVRYSSRRVTDRAVAFRGRYSPIGPVRESKPGSLEHFLTERYCLYTEDRQRHRYRLEIHHHKWPLQPAEAEFAENHVAQPQGIALPDTDPVLHFSRKIQVIGWGLQRI